MTASLRYIIFSFMMLAGINSAIAALSSTPTIPALPTEADFRKAELAAAKTIVWLDDINSAINTALSEYKPIVVFFSSDSCAWSRRMRNETFTDAAVKSILRDFVPVIIDIDKTPRPAQRYGIMNTPTILFLSSDAEVIGRLGGYVDAADLAKYMNNLTSSDSNQFTAAIDKLLKIVGSGMVSADILKEITITMGQSRKAHRQLIQAVSSMKKFPAEELVKLLTNPQLAVRLGALEILEERAGDNFGFDPWYEKTPSKSDLEALDKWQSWKKNGKYKTFSSTAAMTAERYRSLIGNVLGSNRSSAFSAALKLKNSGRGTLTAVNQFLKTHPQLPLEQRKKLREIQYAVIFSDMKVDRPFSLAHRLVYGTQNTRIEVLSKLSGQIDAMPVFEHFLNDSEPVIRETTLDAMFKCCNREANVKILSILPLVQELLKKEKNDDVIFCIIKNLRKIKTLQSQNILTKYLKNSNEDLVTMALDSLSSMQAKNKKSAIIQCLSDPRWRIQVAALKAVSSLKFKDAKDKVLLLLESNDAFVRENAINTVAELQLTDAEKILKKLFIARDELKAPVIRAYCRMKLPIPLKFIKELKNKNSDILLSVIQELENADEGTGGFLATLAEDNNSDIAVQSIRILSRRSNADNNTRYILFNKILQSGDENRIRALLSNFNVEAKQVDKLKKDAAALKNVSSADYKKAKKQFDSLLSAFDDSEEDSGDAKKVEMQELFGAFAENDKEDQEKYISPEEIAEAFVKFNNGLKQLFRNSKNSDIRFYSAIVAMQLNDASGVAFLEKIFPSLTKEKKEKVIQSLNCVSFDYTKKLWTSALRDKSVAETAFDDADNFNRNIPLTLLVLNELNKKDAYIKFYNQPASELFSLFDKENINAEIVDWAEECLNNPASIHDAKIAALYVLGNKKVRNNLKLLRKYAKSDNFWLKRMAILSLALRDHQELDRYIPEILKSKNAKLRLLISQFISIVTSRNSNKFVYFDEKHILKFYSYGFWDRRRRKYNPSKAVVAALNKLTNDISPNVRVESYFGLMATGEKINPAQMVLALKKLQDRSAVEKRVSQYLADNYQKLDKRYKPLLQLVSTNYFSERTLARIKKHFKADNKQKTKKTKNLKLREVPAVQIAAAASPPSNHTVKALKTPVKLVFFYKNGCVSCDHVKKELNTLQSTFPELEVEIHNIFHVDAMRLNETYCERFNVPEKIRMVAPAVFMADGYLIKNDIDFDRLCRLASDSIKIKNNNWYVVKNKEIDHSEKRITKRFSHITTTFVLLAGLNDGINPCAFATIIFFISYMFIGRRRRKEILLVAGAFICGVFAAYYLMGMGLSELVIRLQIIRNFSKYVNIAMIIIVSIIVILSLYDGILCLKGRIEDMSLQLPEFLKERIKSTIRFGTRQYHFILAAFITGIAISVLELACTGQVYLPTIIYMLKTGQGAANAYWLLGIYNVAFIIPLIAILLLAVFGMKNTTMVNLFRKHAAAVKFSTALLFTMLLILLIWGSHI